LNAWCPRRPYADEFGTALADEFGAAVAKVEVSVGAVVLGRLVILDNLGSHKGKRVRRVIRQAGAHLLFLLPYSPDLNPIKQLFAKLNN